MNLESLEPDWAARGLCNPRKDQSRKTPQNGRLVMRDGDVRTKKVRVWKMPCAMQQNKKKGLILFVSSLG